jgi:two-component system, OmpR family, phosphate regulon sensor histidine kinase PhoR
VTGWLPQLGLRPGTRQHASRRLRRLVLGSLLCLTVLLVLLLHRVYAHLHREVVYQYRTAAEEVVYRIKQQLSDVLHTEEARAFDAYSFLQVTSNPLLQGTAVTTSPLSALPPQSAVPGVIGYFQINPDGSVHSPVLPELSETELAANAERFGFGAPELAKRLTLRRQLERLLLIAPSPTDAKDEEAETSQKGPDAEPVRPAARAPAEFFHQTAPAKQRVDLPSSSDRASRKEQVALPEQSTASQVQEVLDRLHTASPAASGHRFSSDIARQPAATTPENQARQQGTVNILTFESEVDPFQLTVRPGGSLVFFRRAWRNNLRYFQGFAVNQSDFFRQLIEASASGTAMARQATLTVQYQGSQLFSQSPEDRGRSIRTPARPQPIYRATLEAPLDAVDVVFSVAHLPRGASATVVDLLALALALVLAGGHYGLYRIGQQHIELAAQRSDFVSAVSHELKTPLTSIRMYGEMLREGWISDDTQRQSYYDFIFFESERLSRLIANILHLARLTTQAAPLPLKAYALCQLLDLVRSKVSTQVEAANFTLQMVEPEDVQAVETYSGLVDEDAFVQIFINLVDNAIKFSAAAATRRIDVGLRLPRGRPPHAVFFVRDYGPGVARDQMQRIFQLFYRGEDELTRHSKGTGIGLALVQALATKMGATVEVHNQNPRVEFCLVLPVE